MRCDMAKLNSSYRLAWKTCAASYYPLCHPTIARLESNVRLLQIAHADHEAWSKHTPRPRRWGRRKIDLRPILRFLAARVGTPFDMVYSELARDADPRSTSGWSLRANALALVQQESAFITRGLEQGFLFGFYVDPESDRLAFRMWTTR